MHSSILRASLITFAIAGASDTLAANGPGLSTHFDNADSPWALPGLADTLVRQGDAKISEGVLALGSNGQATLGDYVQPQGPFSIEVRFKLDQYGPMSTRWISDLVNTATWNSTLPQGFTLRVGGGELYPVLPSTAYDDADGYGESNRYFDRTSSASISRCVGEFNIGTGGSYWKEVYTDVCIDLNRWVHMVAVYDGVGMHLFLDGVNATDPWRVQAQKAEPKLDPKAMLHIGASTLESFDSRHAYGKIDYVRIHDTAMSPGSIRTSYLAKASDDPQARCGRRPVIVTPQTGKWNDGRSRIMVRLMPTPGCADTLARPWKKGDRVHVRIHRGQDGAAPVEVVMEDSVATFDSLLEEGQSLPEGEVLISAALDSAADRAVAGRSMAGATLNFGPSRPILVGASVGVRHPDASIAVSYRWNQSELQVVADQRPVVLSLDGRKMEWSSRRIENGWAVTPRVGDKGMFLVKTSGQSFPVLLP